MNSENIMTIFIFNTSSCVFSYPYFSKR